MAHFVSFPFAQVYCFVSPTCSLQCGDPPLPLHDHRLVLGCFLPLFPTKTSSLFSLSTSILMVQMRKNKSRKAHSPYLPHRPFHYFTHVSKRVIPIELHSKDRKRCFFLSLTAECVILNCTCFIKKKKQRASTERFEDTMSRRHGARGCQNNAHVK